MRWVARIKTFSPAFLSKLRRQAVFGFEDATPIPETPAETPVTPADITDLANEPGYLSSASITPETPASPTAKLANREPLTLTEQAQALQQLQQQVKMLRREQEYLLNVTESSQAFLETLSRELISILKILGQQEDLDHDP